jgi:hypothetical protein
MRSDWEFTYDRESVGQFGSQWADQDSPLPGLSPTPVMTMGIVAGLEFELGELAGPSSPGSE